MRRGLIWVFVFAMVGLGGWSDRAVALGQAVSPPSRILFIDTTTPGQCSLAVINRDGSGFERISPPFRELFQPKVSPKDGAIAFSSQPTATSSEIFLLDAGFNQVRLLRDAALAEGFSPDGRFLLCSTFDAAAELFSVSVANGQGKKISGDLTVAFADWSPTGDAVVASVLTENGTTDLFLLSPEGMEPVRLTDTPEENENSPMFLGDGGVFLYNSDRVYPGTVVAFDLTTRTSRLLFPNALSPRPSSDGQWVVFEDGGMIGVCRQDGSDRKMLTWGRNPAWLVR